MLQLAIGQHHPLSLEDARHRFAAGDDAVQELVDLCHGPVEARQFVLGCQRAVVTDRWTQADLGHRGHDRSAFGGRRDVTECPYRGGASWVSAAGLARACGPGVEILTVVLGGQSGQHIAGGVGVRSRDPRLEDLSAGHF